MFSDSDGVDFVILSIHNKQWHFEASSVEERDEWVAAIEQQILCSLQVKLSAHDKSIESEL
jgi:Arf-GAP with GTPase, ANK repeat and PH domain-containing protein 1/3/4/5/6/9/11